MPIMQPQVQYVRSADGTHIAYTDMGEGVPLVFSSNIWAHLDLQWEMEWREPSLQLVGDSFHLVRYNMRGMGMSDRDVEDFSIESQVADLEALREHLQLERFALWGMVFATPACIAYAAQYPTRLTHLILTTPFVNGAEWYRRLPTMQGLESFRAMGDEKWELYTLTHATALTAANASGDDAPALARLMRSATTPATLRRYLAALREQDVTPMLARVQAPTLIQQYSGLGNEFARVVVAGVAGARLMTMNTALGWREDAGAVTRFVLGREPSADHEMTEATPTATVGTAIILFADIVDSTAITERIGDAAFHGRSDALHRGVREALAAAGGRVVEGRVLGDGVMAVFDAAKDAIAGALRCHEAAAGLDLQLHVGIHAGDVIRDGQDVHGGAVNIAARVASASAPGETLVSDVVRSLGRTSAGVAFDDRGEHALKGIEEPQRLYAVRSNT